MLREIKEELRKGPASIDSLSIKLGISRGRVEDALRLLIQMGAIEELKPDECSTKGLICAFCPLAKSCGKSQIKIYRLRDKRDISENTAT